MVSIFGFVRRPWGREMDGRETEDLLINACPKCCGIRILPRSIEIVLRATDKAELTGPAPLPARHLLSPWLLQRRKQSSQPDFDHPLPVNLNSIAPHPKISKHKHSHSDRGPAVESTDSQFRQVDDDPPGVWVVNGVPGVGEPLDV